MNIGILTLTLIVVGLLLIIFRKYWMKKSNSIFKIIFVLIGIFTFLISLNAMTSGDYTGAGLLLLTATVAFGLVYRKK